MSKTRRKTKRQPIPRQTRHFQLRRNHPQDAHVAEILDYARQQRREVTLIRDAVQMYYALEQGDMRLLLEKFSWVGKALAVPTPPPANGGGGQGKLDDINAKLEMLIAQQTTGGYTMQSAAPAAPGPKPLGGLKPIAALAFFDDDDQDTLVIKKSTTANSSQNLVLAMQGLQG